MQKTYKKKGQDKIEVSETHETTTVVEELFVFQAQTSKMEANIIKMKAQLERVVKDHTEAITALENDVAERKKATA